MANYKFLDAYSSVITAASSTIGGVEYPVVQVSVMPTSSVSGQVGASIIGLTPVTFSGTPSISGAVTVVGNPSVSGTVGASIIGAVNVNPSSVEVLNPVSILAVTQSGAWSASLVGTIPGSVVAFQGTPEWTVKSSISGGIFPISGSVAATITNSALTVDQGTGFGSVASHIKSGSVIAVLGGNTSVLAVQSGAFNVGLVAPSIVGTYAEDAGHTTADKGVFTLGVRNDAVASISGSNLDYTAIGTDSAGRTLTKPFSPEESRVEGYIALTSTSVTTLVAAAGAGLRNYITDVLIANTGAATTLVTFKDGLGSILGYTIAPTTGGSNIVGMATPIRTGANATFDVQAATASSTLYATVKGFKAP